MQRDLDARNLEISALSCHGNPLHPNPAYADRAGTVFRKTVLAAEKLGVRQVVLFAGCPGTPDGGEYPNWVSTGWPGYFEELLEWQWEEQIIPFWKEGAAFAGEHGVRLAFEPHPGDCVFNGPSMRRLREACWRERRSELRSEPPLVAGHGPVGRRRGARPRRHAVPRARKGHLHRPSRRGAGRPARHFGAGEPGRSWRFATIGYGHDVGFWRQLAARTAQRRATKVWSASSTRIRWRRSWKDWSARWRSSAGPCGMKPSASLSWLTDPPALTTIEKQRGGG